MLRAFFGALAGYVVLAAVVIVTLSLAWQFLGCGFAYKAPGSFETTFSWSVVALAMGFLGGFAGGKTALLIGRWKAVKVLALVILILGMMGAISQAARDEAALTAEREGVDPCDLTTFEAASKSSSPLWYAFLNPWVGAAAVWVAGRGGRPAPAAENKG